MKIKVFFSLKLADLFATYYCIFQGNAQATLQLPGLPSSIMESWQGQDALVQGCFCLLVYCCQILI